MNNGFFRGLGEDCKVNIICDIDEIIVLQTPKWCKNIYDTLKDDEEVNKEIDLIQEPLYNADFILSREEYYLDKWLKKPSVESVSDETRRKILDIYNNDRNFYTPDLITNLGRTLPNLVSTSVVEKIYYVSKGDKNPAWESKLELIDNFFYVERKTEIIRVPLECSKNEYIEKNIPYEKINLLIEDEPNNIIGMIDGCLKDNEMIIMFPMYGYGIHNRLSEEEIENYYRNKKKFNIYYNKR